MEQRSRMKQRSNSGAAVVDDLAGYAGRPTAFYLRYALGRRKAHLVILSAVVAAVLCSILTQYAVKLMVDALSNPGAAAVGVWTAFTLLVALIAGDNFLWRIASWIANRTFVKVTGDVRRDLFRHLMGHSPSYFAGASPGTLTSRVSAASQAMFTVENMLAWNVLPPCLATLCAIALVGTVSLEMATALIVVAGLVIIVMFRRASLTTLQQLTVSSRTSSAMWLSSRHSAARRASIAASMRP
jgi:ATP-binding cassette subfamily B protein